MALVQCPECANQVSDQATACPGCGYPLVVTPSPASSGSLVAKATQRTSSFWRCPSCGKHVPTRQSSCLCGFNRPHTASVSVADPRLSATLTPSLAAPNDGSATRWAIATLLAVGLVLAGGLFALMNTGGQPKQPQAQVPAIAREQPAVPRGPEAYFLPAAVGSPSTQQAGAPGPSVLTPAEQVEQAARRLEQEKERTRQQESAARPEQGREGGAAAGLGGAPSQDEVRRREEARQLEQERQQRSEEERSKAAFWRAESDRVVGGLRAALNSYQTQFCNDMRGAQTLYGGGEDMRSRYLSARSLARDLEERARRADARSLIDVRWDEFPEPEAAGPVQPARLRMMRDKWKCPAVY